MQTLEIHCYEFGEFNLDPARRMLLRNGTPVALTPKALDTLLLLVRHRGQIVSKETLLNEIWPDVFVEEGTLSQNIFTVRRALGQRPDGDQFIETLPRHGYRFVARVREQCNGDLVFEQHSRADIFSKKIEVDVRQLVPESILQPHVSPASQKHRLTVVRPARSSVWSVMSRRPRSAVLVLPLVGVLLMIGIGVLTNRRNKRTGPVFQPTSIGKLTTNGNVSRATISPDGTYVVYSTKQGAQESLWLQQVGSAREIQIVPPAEAKYRGLSFAPDGNSIYYSRYEKTNPVGELYRSSVLGGTPSPVLSNIDSAVAFSPDGKRICFFRNFPDRESPFAFSTVLVLANADGSGQQMLGSYRSIFLGAGPAWSPDGKTIVFPILRDDIDSNRVGLVALDVERNAKTYLTPAGWNSIGQVSWASTGDALLFDAWEESMSSSQLWEVSYPSGETRRLTNDLNSYSGASFGGNALITTQSERVAAFWVTTPDNVDRAKQITSGAGDKSGEVMGLSWTPDGRIVYGSTRSGQPDLWIMNADGNNQTQLTINSKANLRPSSSRDGLIAFTSRRTGESHLWIMDSDGANQKQLSNDNVETLASFFPDGRWLAYISYQEGLPRLWKISIDTQQKIQLNPNIAGRPAVSPDGRFVACLYEESPVPFRHVAIVPATGGEAIRKFELAPDVDTAVGIRWTSDGKAIAYVREIDGFSNIWLQPIDGTAPEQLTHFTSAKIFRFAWSQDGSKLALERGVDVQDAVILRR